ALETAGRVMRAEASPIRHVVLLTDGVDTKTIGGYFGSVASEMAAAGITVTTVGLGYSIDERALKDLARQGGGRYLYAPTARELPRILTRDTRTVLDARDEKAAEKARIDERGKKASKPPEPKSPKPPPKPPPSSPPPPLPPTPADDV